MCLIFNTLTAHVQSFPENMPDNSICINYCADDFPWLLKERCKKKRYYPPEKTQYLKRLIMYIKRKEHIRKHKREILRNLKNMFKQARITYKKMSKKQTAHYMQKWFQLFVPKAQHEEAVKYCFPTKTYNAYLWHTFSYGTTPCEEKVPASKSYDALIHNACVLLLNRSKIAFVLGNANQLTSKVINKFTDIIVTDKDFKWTYVHTHEEYCGPYFAYPPSE